MTLAVTLPIISRLSPVLPRRPMMIIVLLFFSAASTMFW